MNHCESTVNETELPLLGVLTPPEVGVSDSRPPSYSVAHPPPPLELLPALGESTTF